MNKSFQQIEPLDDTGAQDAEGVGLEVVGELIELTNTGVLWDRAGAELVHSWLTRALYGEGYQVVPKEPTEAMRSAATRCDYNGAPTWVRLADAGLDVRFTDSVYRAMLAATGCEQ